MTSVRLVVLFHSSPQLLACAHVLGRHGFLAAEIGTSADFAALKCAFENSDEPAANEAWPRVYHRVQSLSSVRLAQVCEEAIEKLQSSAENLQSRVMEAQEELEEKRKEIEEKNA